MLDETDIKNTDVLLLITRIELESMLAENTQRIIEGKSLAYTEEAFMNLIEKYSLKYDEIIEERKEKTKEGK